MHERKREPNLWTNKMISEKESVFLSVCSCMWWRAWLYVCTHFTHIHSSSSRAEHFVCIVCIFCVVCTEYTIYLFIFVVLCVATPFYIACSSLLFFLTSQWFFIAFRKCSVLLFTSVMLLLMLFLMLMLVCLIAMKMSSDMLWVYGKQIKNRMAARWWRCHCWCIEYIYILRVHVKRPNYRCNDICTMYGLCLYLSHIHIHMHTYA